MADTVRTLSALQTLLADNPRGDISEQDLRDMLVSVFPRATNFTPSITAASGGWGIGNGSQFGNYMEFGDLVFLSFRIVWGTTTTNGTGNYTLDLPVAADTSGGELRILGSGFANNQGTKIWPIQLELAADGSDLKMEYFDADNARAPITNAVPFTWANTDVIGGSIVYQKRAVT